MKRKIYICLLFFCMSSCLNRKEELKKVQREGTLCALISQSVSENKANNQFIGNVLCLTKVHEKVQEINKKDYFGIDDH
ncbi:MAG: hypothetical protein IPQ05_03445 [Leptospiraceae bacterium]|nr:hypothetical protein [Leptospiraceae bacterium]MBK9498530.1 hypothetical protein [Leptospiraceae bacterium]MBL0262934.1 hypothetical protein [Leptospiraceae bacterium]